MEALEKHMLAELYRVVCDPNNPERLERGLALLECDLAELGSRVGRLEVKFAITAGFMSILGGLGIALVSAWHRVRGG